MSLLPSRGPETSTDQEGELQVVGVDEDVAPIFDALSSDTARDVLNAIYEEPGTPSEIADRLDMSIQKVSYHLENLADVDLIEVAGTRYSEKGQEMTVYEPPDDPLVLFVGTEDRKRTLRSLVKRVVPTLGVLAVASAVVQSIFGGRLDLGTDSQHAPLSGQGAPKGDAENLSGETTDPEVAREAETSTESVQIAADGAGDGGSATSGATATPTEVPQDTAGPDATGTPAYESTESADIRAEAETPVSEATETPVPESTETPTEIVEAATRSSDGVIDAAAALEPGLAFFLGGVFVLTVVGVVWYASAR